MKLIISTILFFMVVSFSFAQANEKECISKEKYTNKGQVLKLQSHEANTIGVTWDDDDVTYMDFKVSLMYPMFHDGCYKGDNSGIFYLPFPYFAFTGRFGQYIETRDSSPVIGKRFNPKVFGRYWLGSDDDYLDFAFGHESNGQSINSELAYQRLRDSYIANGEDPYFADDSISRGWDYVGLTWKKSRSFGFETLSTYIDLRYFLDDGPLQGKQEELNSWENYEVSLRRKQVHGITLIAKHTYHTELKMFKGVKTAIIYQTGYEDAFDYNTIRAEFTLKFDVPFMVWFSNGYDSDLVGYHKRVKSYGIALEMKSFL